MTVSEEVLINGQPVAVTKDNLHAFIHRKANYKLNIETSEQSRYSILVCLVVGQDVLCCSS